MRGATDGRTFRTQAEAVAGGVPLEKLVRLKRITKGPFKGRVYELEGAVLGRRREDVEEADRRELAAQRQARTGTASITVRSRQAIVDEVTQNPRAKGGEAG